MFSFTCKKSEIHLALKSTKEVVDNLFRDFGLRFQTEKINYIYISNSITELFAYIIYKLKGWIILKV